jgi:type II pantothenate kinase
MSEEEAGRYRLDADQLAEVFARARARVSRDASPGGWRFDSFSRICERCVETEHPGWRRVVIFCDNAGADVMGMVVLARALAAIGGEDTKVALVANTHAALNDVTHAELRGFLSSVAGGGESSTGDRAGGPSDPVLAAQMERGLVTAVPSGQFSTLLDLNRTGPELNAWVEEELKSVPAGDEWLVVFDGMGRGLESNWNPAPYFKDGVNALNLAMVKSEINAKRLGAEVYDCVVKLSVGGSK